MAAGMTMTEQILAKHSGKARVEPGENVWVNVDVLMTHDVCGPGTIGIFHDKFGRDAKVWDGDRVVIIPDHYIFTADEKCHRNVQILRDFVREQGLRYYYDPEFVKLTPTMPNPYRDPELKPTTKASVTKRCPRKGTSARAKFCWALTVIRALPARSGNFQRASATPTRRSSWAPAKPG